MTGNECVEKQVIGGKARTETTQSFQQARRQRVVQFETHHKAQDIIPLLFNQARVDGFVGPDTVVELFQHGHICNAMQLTFVKPFDTGRSAAAAGNQCPIRSLRQS